MKKVYPFIYKLFFSKGSGDTLRIFNQAKVIFQHLPKNLGAVCELGCGNGGPLYTYDIIKRAKKYVGVDGFEPNITLCKTRHQDKANATFILSDVCKVNELEDSSFDYVISTEVIEHVEDDDRMIEEIFRILKPNGTAIISTPLIHTKKNTKNIESITIGKQPIDVNVFEDHKREGYIEAELLEKFKSAGFKIRKIKYCFYSPTRIAVKLMSKYPVPVFVVLGFSIIDYMFSCFRIGKPRDIILFLNKITVN